MSILATVKKFAGMQSQSAPPLTTPKRQFTTAERDYLQQAFQAEAERQQRTRQRAFLVQQQAMQMQEMQRLLGQSSGLSQITTGYIPIGTTGTTTYSGWQIGTSGAYIGRLKDAYQATGIYDGGLLPPAQQASQDIWGVRSYTKDAWGRGRTCWGAV